MEGKEEGEIEKRGGQKRGRNRGEEDGEGEKGGITYSPELIRPAISPRDGEDGMITQRVSVSRTFQVLHGHSTTAPPVGHVRWFPPSLRLPIVSLCLRSAGSDLGPCLVPDKCYHWAMLQTSKGQQGQRLEVIPHLPRPS